jgi:hypothetical protein
LDGDHFGPWRQHSDTNKPVKRRLECVAGDGPELSELCREGIANSNLLGRDGERKGAAEWDWDF